MPVDVPPARSGAFSRESMYIDPGAGSIIIQAVSAVVIAGLASFSRVRRYFSEWKHRFKR